MNTLPAPSADEVELRALVNNAVQAFGSLIIAACGPNQHLGHLLSQDARDRLVEGDYLLNTVHDVVTHYWEELTPSPAGGPYPVSDRWLAHDNDPAIDTEWEREREL